MTIICDYNKIRDEIVDTLSVVNTTTATYDLSLGLDRRVSEVVKYDVLIKPEFKPRYPIVSVKLDLKNEYPECFNNRRTGRIIDLYFHIHCIYDSFKDSQKNLWALVRNVETNLRNTPNLNAYSEDQLSVNYINISGMTPSAKLSATNSNFNKVATIQLQVNCTLDRMGVLVWGDETGAGAWDRNAWS